MTMAPRRRFSIYEIDREEFFSQKICRVEFLGGAGSGCDDGRCGGDCRPSPHNAPKNLLIAASAEAWPSKLPRTKLVPAACVSLGIRPQTLGAQAH